MMYWNGDWNWAAWAGMTASMALFWGVIAWAAVLLMRRSPSERSGTPEEILAARFAHGDIDDGEYERRLETLHSRNRS